MCARLDIRATIQANLQRDTGHPTIPARIDMRAMPYSPKALRLFKAIIVSYELGHLSVWPAPQAGQCQLDLPQFRFD